jgi:hypothetical protein
MMNNDDGGGGGDDDLWAYAAQMHMDISQEPSFAEIYRELAGWYHLDWTLGLLTLTVRTPQCGHIVWGIKMISYIFHIL